MAPDRPAVSKRGGRRSRARKRRAGAGAEGRANLARTPSGTGASRSRKDGRVSGAALRRAAERERPRSLWHPLPVSEVLIFAGAVGVAIALFSSHPQSHLALLGAGIGAIALGSLEVALREHLAGFRKHTLLLSVIPAVAFHSAVILVLVAFMKVPRWLSFPLLAPDLALFALAYRYLRRRYADASRERAWAAGR